MDKQTRETILNSLTTKVSLRQDKVYTANLDLCNFSLSLVQAPTIDIVEKYVDSRDNCHSDYAVRSADGFWRCMRGSYEGVELVYLRDFMGPNHKGQIHESSITTTLRGGDKTKYPSVKATDQSRFDYLLLYIENNFRP